MALVADAQRRCDRPDHERAGADQVQSGFAPPDRLGVERRRSARHGAAAVPLAVPVLRRARPRRWRPRAPELPAVSAQLRYLSRRAVQPRQLCAAHAHGGAAIRPGCRRFCLGRRRLPYLQQSLCAGARAAGAAAAAVSHAPDRTPAGHDLRLHARGFFVCRLRTASAYRGRGCGVTRALSQAAARATRFGAIMPTALSRTQCLALAAVTLIWGLNWPIMK